MKYSFGIAAAAVTLMFAGASSAASFQEAVDSCLSRYANSRDAVLVMLQCTAEGGKLSGCKILENNGKAGFDKAALCVADALPMGAKTGDIKVPIRFPGGN